MTRHPFTAAAKREADARAQDRCEATGQRYGLEPGVRCNADLLKTGRERDHFPRGAHDPHPDTVTAGNCVVCCPAHNQWAANHTDKATEARIKRVQRKHGTRPDNRKPRRKIPRRIFANSMAEIARALGVPIKELIALVCDEVMPPMDDPDDADHVSDVPKMVDPEPAASPTPEDATAKPAEAPPPTAPAGNLFTLYDTKTREWLSRSGKMTTRDETLAYRGTFDQASNARDTAPLAKSMKIIPFIK